ncbi:hypothetical protein DMC01_09370 [Campylobacter troglodytis]|nr:hypothetical protein DMC01_09370 [Campylobacter troglodytis]
MVYTTKLRAFKLEPLNKLSEDLQAHIFHNTLIYSRVLKICFKLFMECIKIKCFTFDCKLLTNFFLNNFCGVFF